MKTCVTLIGSLAIALSLSGTAPLAQAIPPQSIEDQVLGWIKIYDYKGATLPIKVDQRVYSPAQLSIAQLFANWMQASYLPTGALGDVRQIVSEKLGPYNQNTAALPQSYGAFAKLYTELKYGVNKKREPLTNSHLVWTIEANGGTAKRLPVYTIDPRLVELCKTDAPRWIVMSWTAQLNDPASRSLHEAILNNVNVEYIYDYFFDPDKVKGQPYKPLRSPSFVETAVAAEPSEAARKTAADPTVHFFDDFSSGVVGKKPLNWKSTLDSTGASSVVTELKGLDGHWASMSGLQLTPCRST